MTASDVLMTLFGSVAGAAVSLLVLWLRNGKSKPGLAMAELVGDTLGPAKLQAFLLLEFARLQASLTLMYEQQRVLLLRLDGLVEKMDTIFVLMSKEIRRGR